MRIFTLFLFLSCFPGWLFSQSFTKVEDSPIDDIPTASRSANFIDVNGDGWDDAFISNGPSSGQNNMLYFNNQDGTFTTATNNDIVEDNGKCDGASFGDVDNDGDLDAIVVNWYGQPNFFFRNQGDGVFDYEPNSAIGVAANHSETASLGNLNGDAWLDVFVTNSDDVLENELYENTNFGQFNAITTGGIVTEARPSRSVDWIDYDNDGDEDIFVGNESSNPNSLFRNNGDGTFSSITSTVLTQSNRSTMGSSWADIDNDGDFDLFVANFSNQNNQLFLNNGDGTFTAITGDPVVTDGGCSFGSAFADADNDGDVDLFVGNAFCNNGLNNFFYENQGDGTFVKVDDIAPVTDQGWTFGCAWGDMDNDGYLDLLLANCKDNSQTNALYQNDGSGNNWVKYRLSGTMSNKSGIGAVLRLRATIGGESRWQTRRVAGQSGYCSQNSLTVHFGLADATEVDSLIVEWPSGETQTFSDLDINLRCDIIEGADILCATSLEPVLESRQQQWRVFPNPAQGDLVVLDLSKLTAGQVFQIQLSDQKGRILHRQNVRSGEEVPLSIEGLAAGTYQVQLQMGQIIQSQSIIIVP